MPGSNGDGGRHRVPRIMLTVEADDCHEAIDKLDRLSDALRTAMGLPTLAEKFDLEIDRRLDGRAVLRLGPGRDTLVG